MPEAANLNTDAGGVTKTSSSYGDTGDGVSRWFHNSRIRDGGDTAKGLKADAAVTDPTSSGSVIALLKGLLTFLRISAAGVGKAEDAVASSGDTGIMPLAIRRDTPTSDAAAGDYHGIHVDALGRLRTIEKQSETLPSNFTPAVLVQGTVCKASAGTLFGVQGYCAAAGYVLIHDKASAVSAGEAPRIPIPTQGTAAPYPFSIGFGDRGRAFSSGIAFAFSSTGTAYTAGGTSLWIDAQYE